SNTQIQCSTFATTLDYRNHRLPIQHAGDVVRYRRCHFALSDRWEVAEQSKRKFSANRSKGVAVEEKKRGATVKAFQQVDCLQQSQLDEALRFPALRARF